MCKGHNLKFVFIIKAVIGYCPGNGGTGSGIIKSHVSEILRHRGVCHCDMLWQHAVYTIILIMFHSQRMGTQRQTDFKIASLGFRFTAFKLSTPIKFDISEYGGAAHVSKRAGNQSAIFKGKGADIAVLADVLQIIVPY